MTVERREAPVVGGEREMLEAWLDYHRATLEWKCEGLSVEQLRQRSVPPSNLSLLGLVRHMAEVERGWFRGILAGEDIESLYSEEDRDGDFNAIADADPAEAFATWKAECGHAREVAKAFSLDDLGRRAEKQRGHFNLRWILIHMIEEYARHNGHADLLRETIDGATGD